MNAYHFNDFILIYKDINGKEKGTPFDIAILDMQMPVMDDLEATEKNILLQA